MDKYLILCAILILTASCKNDDLPSEIEKNLSLNQKIVVDDVKREYHIYIPDEPSNKPVVMVLHGGGGSADQALGLPNKDSPQKLWLSLAEQHNFIVIVPNGTIGPANRRGWNDCRSDWDEQTQTDDVAFLSTLLDKIKTRYNYDDKRVYVAGVSNGGFMTLRLAMEIPEKITAIAAVIANMPFNTECADATIPISALFMNGTQDSLVPYNGGDMSDDRGTVLSVDDSIEYWKIRNGITGDPIEETIEDINTQDGCNVVKYLYQNGTNNTEVSLYKVINGGHAEPSIAEKFGPVYRAIVGNQNYDMEMATEIWSFFEGKSH